MSLYSENLRREEGLQPTPAPRRCQCVKHLLQSICPAHCGGALSHPRPFPSEFIIEGKKSVDLNDLHPI